MSISSLYYRRFLVLALFFALEVNSFAAEGHAFDSGGQQSSGDRAQRAADAAYWASASGQYDVAIRYYTSALQLGPSEALATDLYWMRGSAYLKKGDRAQAAADYDRALRYVPQNADDYWRRGRIYEEKGNYSEAAAALMKAKQLSPNDPFMLNALAWVRATSPDGAQRNSLEALQSATRACELTHWRNSGFIDTLAAACAEAGKFEDAVKYQEQAISKTERSERRELEDHLAVYRQHKPWREHSSLVAR